MPFKNLQIKVVEVFFGISGFEENDEWSKLKPCIQKFMLAFWPRERNQI